MSATSSSSSNAKKAVSALMSKERERRQKIQTDIKDAGEDMHDPLALYDGHLTWILDNFAPEQLHVSGIVEFLEEGTRRFAKEAHYKKDPRNLRLWTTFASLVDKPCPVFKFILSLGVGTTWALLYLEYALALERENRTNAAEQVLEAGLKRKATPTLRLKKALDDLRRRIATIPRTLPPAASIILPRLKGSPETDALRANPLKYHTTSTSKPAQSQHPPPPRPPSPLATYTTTSVEERYAVIRAPDPPTKRPERLHIDMTTLFPDGLIEYSVEEIRMRSSRYIPREPTPPPPSPPAIRQPSPVRYSPAHSSPPDSPEFSQEVTTDLRTQIDFNDDGTKSSKRYLERRMDRRSIGLSNEPTVTINTKAALADVFGMYNSPDKTTSFDRTPGSKHAPVRKMSPPRFDLQPQTPTNSNPASKRTNGSIEPYVDDENAGRKENAAIVKFKPFVDNENPPRADAFTPGSNRSAFSLKETPAHTPYSSGLSKVFTPASASSVFRAQSLEVKTPVASGLRPAFTPLAQATPSFRIFSGPSENENAGPTPARSGAFTPFVDENASMPTRTPLGERQPLRSAFTMAHEAVQEESEEEIEEVEYSLVEEEAEEEGHYEERDYRGQELQPAYANEEVEEDYDEMPAPGHRTPMGGRLGKFDVLTPITERTYEYTSASHVSVYSSGGTGRFFGAPDAISAAARLAEEVRSDADGVPLRPATAKMMAEAADDYDGDEEDLMQHRKPPPFRLSDGHTIDGPSLHEQHAGLTEYVEKRTGTLSLADTLDLTNRVSHWPNPCNPFDPSIIASILAFFAQDAAHFDFPHEDSAQLEKLQRFARKKASGTKVHSDGVGVTLGTQRFLVDNKLGEGGFGAVFAAQRLKPRLGFDGDDSFEDDSFDDDEADDDDDEVESRFALKIVKPRNLWEFYVLRKVHATLPANLCVSIIFPHSLYAYRDESILMLRLCEQGSLLNVINKAVDMRISQKGAFLDELLVVFFTIELLRTVGGLHTSGFIHGDLKIDNCLIRLEECGSWDEVYDPSGAGGWARKGITLIDFGRTIDTSLFPRDQQYIAEWATDQRDCAEMRAKRPWTYQADYFGLAGIVFCMLFSRYIDDGAVMTASNGRARLATPLKRYWQTELWTRLFDMLLNPASVRADGTLPIIDELAEIREEFERWLVANCKRSTNTLRGLLKKITLSTSE